MINIFYSEIQKDIHDDLLRFSFPHFSEECKEKLLKYQRWQDAQLSLMGKLLLKIGLIEHNSNHTLKELMFTKYNKPFFYDEDIQFNISHSGEIVVCAITSEYSTIGIDIENIQTINVKDFESYMTENEQHTIFSSEEIEKTFFSYWTQKEAVLKAHGEGLSIPLKSFEIKNNEAIIDMVNYFLYEIALFKNYSCHIASNEKLQSNKITITKIDIKNFFNHE